jgi:hypothetical protein
MNHFVVRAAAMNKAAMFAVASVMTSLRSPDFLSGQTIRFQCNEAASTNPVP